MNSSSVQEAWGLVAPYFDSHALTGGILVGFASLLLFAANGRIAGISGIVGKLIGSLPPFSSTLKETIQGGEWFWRLFFLLGLLAGGFLLENFLHEFRAIQGNTSTALTILAGLLVGFGTRLGWGCTSGHGVCGIGRFSVRSVLATCIFIASGMVVTALLRFIGGFN